MIESEGEKALEPVKSPLRRSLRIAFGVFSLLCFGWVVAPLFGQTRAILDRVELSGLGLAMAVSALLYASLGALLATAWWWLTEVYDRRPRWIDGYSIWGRSQWAKYLPTNTLHLVSRQLLGRAAGLNHPTLAASAVLETASLMAAASLTVVAGTPPSEASSGALRASRWALLVLPVGLLAWPLVESVARRFTASRILDALPRLTLRRQLLLLTGSLPLHCLFFVLTSGLLLLLSTLGWRQGAGLGVALLWVYPASWIVGTLTPGAPAGVGVREAVLVLGLAPSIGRVDAAALAIALRAVTTSGDALTAIVAWAISKRYTSGAPGATER